MPACTGARCGRTPATTPASMPGVRFVHDPSLALGSETLNRIRRLADGASE